MYSLGIDLGGTNIAIGLCDAELNIIDKDSTPTLAKRGTDAIMDDMTSLARTIIERNSLKISDISYVGIATPGSVDEVNGVVEVSYNIKMLSYPIKEEFKKRLPINKVYVANDANAAALGEAIKGAAKGTKSSVMITLGTGVGSGVIIDGRIFSGGMNNFGAELGHMVIKSGGRPCTCGRRGCFEAYASASALTNITREKMDQLKILGVESKLFECAEKEGKISARTAFDAMRLGDEHARDIVRGYTDALSDGIANVINIFQPEVISLGGGVCNEREYLTRPIIEKVDREQYTKSIPRKTEIRIALLKNDAGIIGAAALGK